MLRVVIDNSAVTDDRLGACIDEVRAAIVAGRLDVLWTHVTIDELAAIDDPGKRSRLLCLAASVCRFVPTGACLPGFSRLDMARPLDDVDAAQEYRRGNHRHTREALVAATAEVEGAPVVTYDHAMRQRAERRGLVVYTWPEALAAAAA